MKSFSEHILNEALVIPGNKAYPKFGNVVIMAGGGGSGKGFIADKLVAMEGKVFDVDAIKALIVQIPKYRAELMKTLEDMFKAGEISSVPNLDNDAVRARSMKMPKIVRALHLTAVRINLPNRIQDRFFVDLVNKPSDRKPNIIFDVTLKNFSKLITITDKLVAAGYDRKNVHLIWVMTDLQVAIKQNANRARVVPIDILVDAHKGTSRTMSDIIKMGDGLRKYMDGSIDIVPNVRDANSKFVAVKKTEKDDTKKEKYVGYFQFADHYRIKEPGKLTDTSKMTKQMEKEIEKYTPKGTFTALK